MRLLVHEIFNFWVWFGETGGPGEDSKLEAIDYDQIAALYLANTEIIIESLEDLKGVYRSSLIFPTRISSERDSYYYQWGLCGAGY